MSKEKNSILTKGNLKFDYYKERYRYLFFLEIFFTFLINNKLNNKIDYFNKEIIILYYYS